jgi:acyl-coenzyme A synthetase/AMP-(fatty) acid ligase
MGVCVQVLMPLYGLVSIAVFAPTVIKPEVVPIIGTPESVLEAAQILKPTLMISIPSFIHTWAQSDQAVEFLRTLRCLQYGGGPLAPKIAESLVSRGVRVVTGYGGTEFGVVSELSLESEVTWEYFKFKDGVNVRLVPQGDGTYEVQFLVSVKSNLRTLVAHR